MEQSAEESIPGLPSRLKLSLSLKNGSTKTLERFLTARDAFDTPDAERAEVFRVFKRFDIDGDGNLSVDEIGASLEKLGILVSASDLEHLFSLSAETDGAGPAEDRPPPPPQYVNFDDFYGLYKSLLGPEDGGGEEGTVCTPNGKICDAEFRAAFDLFDKNNDNFISVYELQSVLLRFGFEEAKHEDQCRKMIASVDSDGDGVVSFDEFKIMMQNMK